MPVNMQPFLSSNEYPPNIEEIRKYLKLSGAEVFTYDGIVYNPSNRPMTEDIINHEMLHVGQQHGNHEAWWKLLLEDPLFRLSQEIPAHQVQYHTAKKFIKDRNKLFGYLKQLALNLSSETYGKSISFTEAFRAIKEEKLFNVRNLVPKK